MTPEKPSHPDESPAGASRSDSDFDSRNSFARLQHLAWRGLIGIVLVGVIGWAGYELTQSRHDPAAQEAAGSTARTLPVATVTVEPRDVPLTTRFLAQTEASETVPIRARVHGFLVERSFEEGEVVTKGQELFRIDPEPFEVALRQARAGLTAAEAQLLRAEQQVARFRGLAEVQHAATNELEQAQEAQRIAAAEVETQRTLIERAELDLEYATIESPITGVIGLRQQDVGSYIGGGEQATLLATVRKVDPLYVRYSVSERDLLHWQRMIDAGSVTNVPMEEIEVTVVLPDDREFPHKGRIQYLDVAVDPSMGTAVVRATVPNPERSLRPGQFVHVDISGFTRLDTIEVPKTAVLQHPGGSSVYVVDAEGTARARPVTLGDWTSRGWIVESGLEAGDRVIVDHLMQVRPGMPVSPTDVASTALSSTDASSQNAALSPAGDQEL